MMFLSGSARRRFSARGGHFSPKATAAPSDYPQIIIQELFYASSSTAQAGL